MGANRNAEVNQPKQALLVPVETNKLNTLILHQLQLPSLEFLGPDKRVLRPDVDGVYFGLFDNAVEKDPAIPQWPPSNDPLLNHETEANNFVGADSRRFYIRLSNPSQQDIQTLANGIRIIQVGWFTTYSNGQILDDNNSAATITLIEEKSGVFVS